jgi:hypothetical protein
MPKGAPPGWSRRDCRFDHLVTAAIDKGFGRVLVYSGVESWQRADDIRKGIFRCAKHRGVSADAGPSREVTGQDPGIMGIRKTGRTFELRYRLWSKRDARRAHLDRHGPDRGSWPYDPRRPATEGERESWAARTEAGHTVKGK